MSGDTSPLRSLSSDKLAEIAVFRRAGQKLSELRGLIDRVRELAPKTIVEIGTDKGGTLWLWCQVAALDATIVSIDLPGGDYGEGYSPEDAKVFSTWAHGDQRMHFLLKDSHSEETKAEVMDVLGGHPVDFLFIDGDHRYEGVSQDFTMYAPLVRPGGLVVFHDIVETLPHLNCHSHRFWNEVKTDYEYEELIELDDDLGWRVDNDLAGPWGGIGVLRWP